jgi:hypothetical protein
LHVGKGNCFSVLLLQTTFLSTTLSYIHSAAQTGSKVRYDFTVDAHVQLRGTLPWSEQLGCFIAHLDLVDRLYYQTDLTNHVMSSPASWDRISKVASLKIVKRNFRLAILDF